MGYQNVQRTRIRYFFRTQCCSGYESISESGELLCGRKWHTTLICTILMCCVIIIIMTFTFAMPTIIYTAICEGCDNNHLCIAPGTCVCPTGLTGDDCLDGIIITLYL